MEDSRLERITDTLNDIREANNYISRLQAMAVRIAEGEFVMELTLAGTEPKTSKVAFNEEGDMVDPDKPHASGYKVSLIDFLKPKFIETPDIEFNHAIDEATALKVLALLLEEKQKLKTRSEEKLKDLGVKFK